MFIEAIYTLVQKLFWGTGAKLVDHVDKMNESKMKKSKGMTVAILIVCFLLVFIAGMGFGMKTEENSIIPITSQNPAGI